MAQKRLLIHIGLHKTGASGIQAFLRENCDHLRAQGILCPSAPQEWRDHNPLAWDLIDPKYLPPHRVTLPPTTPAAYWTGLQNEARSKETSKVILSGQDFSLINQPQRLAALCSDFETEILVYLRRQDQYIQSVYNDDVRNFAYMRQETLEQFLAKNRFGDIVHYDQFLQKWADAFGRQKINVGIYEAALLKKGGLIADFAARAGIDLGPGFQVPNQPISSRLSGSLLKVKLILNQFGLNAGQHKVLLDSLTNTPMAKLQREGLTGDHALMSRAQKSAYLDQFRDGNREVARVYCGMKGDLFSEPDEDQTGNECRSTLPDSRTLLREVVGPMLKDITSQLGGTSLSEEQPGSMQAAEAVSGNNFPKVLFRKSALTPESAALFNLPSSAQDNDNLYSMSNWAPVYLPLLDQIRPKCIVEIGSEYGGNTRQLGRYCIERGIRLHVVDTHPTRDAELERSSLISYYQSRSIDFLKDFGGGDIYFVDGDHNYQTLRTELELIAAAHDGERPLLAFVHDTGWPSGIIDGFYDPLTLDGTMPPLSFSQGPLPWASTLSDLGFGKGHVAYAPQPGGPANGLRPAVEDFCVAHEGWRTAYYTPFYGLCLLWKESSLPRPVSAYLHELISKLNQAEPIFATLEWNRLLLYIHTQFMGAEWRQLQDESWRAGETWRKQQEWIEHLEQKLRAAGVKF